MRSPRSLLFSRLNKPSSQPVLIAEVLQPLVAEVRAVAAQLGPLRSRRQVCEQRLGPARSELCSSCQERCSYGVRDVNAFSFSPHQCFSVSLWSAWANTRLEARCLNPAGARIEVAGGSAKRGEAGASALWGGLRRGCSLLSFSACDQAV